MGFGKLSWSYSSSCHLSLAADNRTVLRAECRNKTGRYPELIEQFSYLTASRWDLLALEGWRHRHGETQARSGVERQMWRLLWNDDSWRRIPTCRPQLPQEQGWLFIGADSVLSGRLEGGSSWWDISASLKCSAVRCSDSDQIKIMGFFLSLFLVSFLLPSFPSFILSFLCSLFSPSFFSYLYICVYFFSVYLTRCVKGNHVFHTQANKINS